MEERKRIHYGFGVKDLALALKKALLVVDRGANDRNVGVGLIGHIRLENGYDFKSSYCYNLGNVMLGKGGKNVDGYYRMSATEF